MNLCTIYLISHSSNLLQVLQRLTAKEVSSVAHEPLGEVQGIKFALAVIEFLKQNFLKQNP